VLPVLNESIAISPALSSSCLSVVFDWAGYNGKALFLTGICSGGWRSIGARGGQAVALQHSGEDWRGGARRRLFETAEARRQAPLSWPLSPAE